MTLNSTERKDTCIDHFYMSPGMPRVEYSLFSFFYFFIIPHQCETAVYIRGIAFSEALNRCLSQFSFREHFFGVLVHCLSIKYFVFPWRDDCFIYHWLSSERTQQSPLCSGLNEIFHSLFHHELSVYILRFCRKAKNAPNVFCWRSLRFVRSIECHAVQPYLLRSAHLTILRCIKSV